MIKTFPLVALLVLSCFVCVSKALAQTHYGSTDVATFRAGRDSEFRSADESPLKSQDFASFTGLKYFPVSEDLRVTATFNRTPAEGQFLMPTTAGKSAKYKKAGVLTFSIKGKLHVLNAYQWELPPGEKYQKYKNLLLVPFKDQTNGKETYSVGRYLYINSPENDTTILDFNLAFNPSCAYGSDRYSCPIPPRDNHLTIKIEAGERTYSAKDNQLP